MGNVFVMYIPIFGMLVHHDACQITIIIMQIIFPKQYNYYSECEQSTSEG